MRRPSPAMVVAIAALVMSTTGAAVAAVNFAKNAGKVDGLSAVDADTSNRRAAGKLVATDERGMFPSKFLEAAAPGPRGAVVIAAPDNGLSDPQRVVDLEVGSVSAACFDEQDRPGVENPATRFYVTNHSGETLNVAHRASGGRGAVEVLDAGEAASFVVTRDALVAVNATGAAGSAIVQGGAAQSGAGTADGSCRAFASTVLG